MENIFEGVTFIGEGMFGDVISGLKFIHAYACNDYGKLSKKDVVNLLNAYWREDTYIAQLLFRSKAVLKSITPYFLKMKANNIHKNIKKIIDNDDNKIDICAFVDKNDDIIAYAIKTDIGYGYDIVDNKYKSSSDICKSYICARFELYFDLHGPAIQKFIQLLNNTGSSKNYNGSMSELKNTPIITKDDLKDAYNTFIKVYNAIQFVKSKYNLDLELRFADCIKNYNSVKSGSIVNPRHSAIYISGDYDFVDENFIKDINKHISSVLKDFEYDNNDESFECEWYGDKIYKIYIDYNQSDDSIGVYLHFDANKFLVE